MYTTPPKHLDPLLGICWKLFSQTDMDPHIHTCSISYRAMNCMERKKSTHFCRSEEPMAERVAIEFWILLNWLLCETGYAA